MNFMTGLPGLYRHAHGMMQRECVLPTRFWYPPESDRTKDYSDVNHRRKCLSPRRPYQHRLYALGKCVASDP